MRERLMALAMVAAFGLIPVARAQVLTAPIATGDLTISLQPFVTIPSGQGSPIELTFSPDGSGRLFIATRNGFVRVVNGGGTMASDPFLDFGARGVTVSTGSERGLLGLAFHPDFAAVGAPGFGKFYTHSSEPRIGTPDFNHPELAAGNLGDHHALIREWTVDPLSSNQVLTSSREVLRINQGRGNHNGGGIVFGSDKDLYIALGDGGVGNDGLWSSPGEMNTDGHTNEIGNAQDISNVYGSILRIDPLGGNSANGQYSVPAANPFVGPSGVDEIYAYGLRNPFKITFDRDTGVLYAADVGQGTREELNIITAGGNYGWVFREGTIATPDVSTTPPGGFTPIDPIAEYVNRAASGGGDGNAIIGGFVYRGSMIPQLQGMYVFGDLAGASGFTAGRLFYTAAAGGEILEFQLDLESEAIPGLLHGFGEDAAGELYVYFSGGQVFRIVPEPSAALLLATFALPLLHRRRN